VTGPELVAELKRLGYRTQGARAEAVGLARPTLSGYEREHLPVPPHLVARVRLMVENDALMRELADCRSASS
jgi:hypothetical protein